MTGSHNMGPKASGKNDDNLLMIENAPGLAAEYAVHIMGVYGHYKYRHNQKAGSNGRSAAQKNQSAKWAGLQDNDTWQQGYFERRQAQGNNFWFGEIARTRGDRPDQSPLLEFGPERETRECRP